ncbi:MAG: hypothetical protein FWG54_05395, partial [Bacteroidetes bacterium]|nr:hypothetical protein [Bacteroidota bacterium]
MVKNILLIAAVVIVAQTGCQNVNETQIEHQYWVCTQDHNGGGEIALARMGNVFRGEFIDRDFQDRFSIPIMGTIDKEGNVNGVSGVINGQIGKLSGRIMGNTFEAVWLSTMYGVMNMEMKLTPITPEMEIEINKHPDSFYNTLYPECAYIDMRSRESVPRAIPFLSATDIFAGDYGYSTGEWETRRIQIRAGEKQDLVDFTLFVEEDNGIEAAKAEIRGTAQLKENRFRYREKDHEFEVSMYNGFVVVHSLTSSSPNLGGVYPAQMEVSYYEYTDYELNNPFEAAGRWVRTDDDPDVSSAEIVITDVTPEGFLFSFSGSFVNPYGAYHFGELEEQTASFSSADTALFVYNDGDEPATVLFVFKEGKLIVSVADNCYLPDFGAGVRMEGE